MKIGILGLSKLGLLYLDEMLLNKHHHRVVFVTSKRKSKLHTVNLREEAMSMCRACNIPFLENFDANSEEGIEWASKTDVCVIGGYDAVLEKQFLSAPSVAVLNTHFSLLPNHRGLNPTFWAIFDGDKYTGFSTHIVSEKIDSGHVVDNDIISINAWDTSYSLYNRLVAAAAYRLSSSLAATVNRIYKSISSRRSVYHGPGFVNDGWIDWHWDARHIDKFTRAMWFPSYKGAMTHFGNDEIEVLVIGMEAGWTGGPGTVVHSRDGVSVVRCGSGAVRCLTSKTLRVGEILT